MEVNSLLGGRLLISVPYGTYGGILADDQAAVAALAAEATRRADQCGARVLELRSATAAVTGLDPLEGYLSFVRDLPLDPDDVPAFLPKRARAAARHARDRFGVGVQHENGTGGPGRPITGAPLPVAPGARGQPALLRTVWQLYSRSMRRLASIAYPYRFFAELMAGLGERFWISVAWIQERPVAGTISFVFRDTVMPYVLGVDERIKCEGAANLLYWSVMERAVQSGLRRFDYGRSRADNPGAVGFKKNQGFEPRPLGYQRYVPPGRRPPNLKPSNPRFALARQIWQRLPLPVTRVLSNWLAKSIPG
jgi:hypothetical protein